MPDYTVLNRRVNTIVKDFFNVSREGKSMPWHCCRCLLAQWVRAVRWIAVATVAAIEYLRAVHFLGDC
jgi:hypothetical protein